MEIDLYHRDDFHFRHRRSAEIEYTRHVEGGYSEQPEGRRTRYSLRFALPR